MNPRHYLAHVLLQHHPAPRNHAAVAEVVREHFAKTFSADALTAALRERLGKKRQRDSLQDELIRIERELFVMSELSDERIEALRRKVQELRKKNIRSEPKGP